MPITLQSSQGQTQRQTETDASTASGGNPIMGMTIAQAETQIANAPQTVAGVFTLLKYIIRFQIVQWQHIQRIEAILKQK